MLTSITATSQVLLIVNWTLLTCKVVTYSVRMHLGMVIHYAFNTTKRP